jgi:tetratricopeptide (TPR) repeat protein
MIVANCFRRLCSLSTAVLTLGLLSAFAQDESLSEIRYKEDYDQIQKIIKISEPVKRADQMLAFYRGRTDMDPKLREYADNIFARDLETLMKQRNYIAMKGLSERAIKLRPKFGEAYFFYAVALKFDNKVNEAMNAFAKCYLIANPLQKKAKELLDTTYRSTSGGSLIGEDKIINNAKRELK